MKDKYKGIILSVLDVIIVFELTLLFLVIPSVKRINKLRDVKELTYEEKSALISEVNNKYSDKVTEVNDRYSKEETKINEKYDPDIKSVNEKYDKLIRDAKTKYETEEKDLLDKISDKKVEVNKEFMRNGFSKKYYTLYDEQKALESKQSNLKSELDKEVSTLETNKKSELTPYVINKNSLIKQNDINKANELDMLETNKNKEINDINKKVDNTLGITLEVLKIVLAIVITLIPIFYIIKIYNKLTKLHNEVEESWSHILVDLKRRSDLIPNIVSVVKGYSNHEKNTLKSVVSARNKVVNSDTKEDSILNNEILDKNIKKIFILNEKYPELKSDKSFNKLIMELKTIEDDISISRKEYNDKVLKYTNTLEIFPSNLVAKAFSFEKESYFKTSEEENDNISVGGLI